MNDHSEDDQLLAAMRARDIDDAVAGIREGIADMEAGRTRPLRDIDAEIRKRYGLRSEERRLSPPVPCRRKMVWCLLGGPLPMLLTCCESCRSAPVSGRMRSANRLENGLPRISDLVRKLRLGHAQARALNGLDFLADIPHPRSRRSMPELSRFFGIVIRMYVEVGGPHHSPHFHAYYQDDVAVVGLEPIELIAGSLPRRQRRFVEAWAELHQQELIADWQRLQAGQPPLPIAPLE